MSCHDEFGFVADSAVDFARPYSTNTAQSPAVPPSFTVAASCHFDSLNIRVLDKP